MTEMMPKPYFHELTDEQWQEHLNSHATWGDIMSAYRQPEWCHYPGALEGAMGCWSLIYRFPVSPKYCADCECYKGRGGQRCLTV